MSLSRRESDKKEEFSQAIDGIVNELGYECVHVIRTSESGRPVVRVLIDSLGGINVGDCERVSKAVNRYLDLNGDDPELSGRYYLEVSSPGLERPLFVPKDYLRFQGREARIKTFDLFDGRKLHVGILGASDEQNVILETEEGARTIPFDKIARASLVFRGLEPRDPRGKKNPSGKKKNNEQRKEEHEEEH